MKTTIHLSIDVDIKEAAKVRRFKDPKWSISDEVNSYLRELLQMDVDTLEEDKIEMEIVETEKKLALAKSKRKAIDTEKERQKQEDIEKRYGKGAKVTDFDPLNETPKN